MFEKIINILCAQNFHNNLIAHLILKYFLYSRRLAPLYVDFYITHTRAVVQRLQLPISMYQLVS